MSKSLFGECHRLASITLHDLSKPKIVQTGYSEGKLLCADCDNRLLGGERYACNHIYREPSINSRVKKTFHEGTKELAPFFRYQNLDFSKVKLFLLSILWRCHISRDVAFEDVDLGPHAERIRRMIFENEAGGDDQYEVVVMHIDTGGTRPDKSVIDPRKIKFAGNTFYIFHINELMYHFNISVFNKESLFVKKGIRQDGVLDIAVLKDY